MQTTSLWSVYWTGDQLALLISSPLIPGLLMKTDETSLVQSILAAVQKLTYEVNDLKKNKVQALNGQKRKLVDSQPERRPAKLPRPGPSHADSGNETSDEEMITENETGAGDNEEDDIGADMNQLSPQLRS